MSQPQTMFQLLGRGYAPATLAKATLVVIDAQEEYRTGALALPGIERATAEIRSLMDAAQALGSSIVHVRHLGIPGGPFDPQGFRGHFIPELAPLDGEIVIEKRLPNAFSGTGLNDTLLGLGHLDLIVCGFMTHSSISTTVRAAKDYGYRCTLVDAACATRDIPWGDGIVPADQLHRIEVAALADNFAMVVAQAKALI
jgi:nicotinamidase-related amidase